MKKSVEAIIVIVTFLIVIAVALITLLPQCSWFKP